jgi:ligand-binding SRPBCC domain-containing protein
MHEEMDRMRSGHSPHPISSPASAGVHRLETEQVVATDIEETFDFFSNAANLDAITPPSLGFTILTPLPIEMREGTLIAYRLGLLGIPIHWLTRIDEWTPGRSFTDTQVRGPYAHWVHRHSFAPHPDGTLIRDRVDYALPLPFLTAPVHALFVRPMIERIFAYRREVITRVLG